MQKNVQNGKKNQTVKPISTERKGTKNQCQVKADQINDFFCSIGENVISNICNNPLNLNPSENNTQ